MNTYRNTLSGRRYFNKGNLSGHGFQKLAMKYITTPKTTVYCVSEKYDSSKHTEHIFDSRKVDYVSVV